MKHLKKLMISVLAISMVLSMAACGKANTPTKVVEKQMQELKDEKVETELSSLVSDSSVAKKYGDDYKKLLKKIQDFDYEVTDEKVDGDSATVTVKITTYNFGQAYKDMYNQVVKDANNGKITSSTDLTSYIYKMMFQKMNALEKKDFKTSVKVKCTKNEDGDWETDVDNNSNVEDAILGGVISLSNQNAASSK